MTQFTALPRSVVLALWLQATGASHGLAVRSVTDDDEPHDVVGLPGSDDGATLAELVAAFSSGPREVCALLPAPGDPTGVPAAVGEAAVDAGECVLLATPDGAWAAVPRVTTFGSDLEPGHLVTWEVTPVPPWSTLVAGAVGSLAEAERELRTSLVTATEALDTLDVARWRDDAADAIETVRHSTTAGWPVPDLEGRRARVLQLAWRLLAIVDLATADDGGAVNLWQVDQRSTALREVQRTARRALGAATYAAVR
ncbi:hypothetical protein [Isoptericola dokdonensis]|jgi:hypothetical protein|uniref:Uncharacterized protein n=1 Tax=Isoptericola dokdonensis DS-3 TaxID=1300344 RepID=A0A168ESP0_9MICO|nr:hypothetical protein [Isoptericola dokdonensis]ANC30426.1 hypothetical protein I598_0851 [Isoptericola dokdonensis DS-3]